MNNPHAITIGMLYTGSNEGCRLKTYRDGNGFPTIGFGHLILSGERFPREGITFDLAWVLFQEDYAKHMAEASTLKVYDTPNIAHQIVLVDLVFQMGLPNLQGQFKRFLINLENGQWTAAAKELLIGKNPKEKSVYYLQSPNRAQQNKAIIESGRLSDIPLLPINGVDKEINDRLILEAEEARRELKKAGLAL